LDPNKLEELGDFSELYRFLGEIRGQSRGSKFVTSIGGNTSKFRIVSAKKIKNN
jgi:hypothetical protein